MKSGSETRLCSRCKKYWPVEEFYVHSDEPGHQRIRSRCASCHSKTPSQSAEKCLQNDQDRALVMEALRQQGPQTSAGLSGITGLSSRRIGEVMKIATKKDEVLLLWRWGPSGQSLYALPGQTIPRRLTEEKADPSIRAKIDKEGDDWYAGLMAGVAERAALVRIMRSRV